MTEHEERLAGMGIPGDYGLGDSRHLGNLGFGENTSKDISSCIARVLFRKPFPVPVSSHTFSVSYFVRFKVSTAMWTSWTHPELSFVQTESSEESFIFL